MTASLARRGDLAPEEQAIRTALAMIVRRPKTSNFFLFVIMPLSP
jgi:hypothetical protein